MFGSSWIFPVNIPTLQIVNSKIVKLNFKCGLKLFISSLQSLNVEFFFLFVVSVSSWLISNAEFLIEFRVSTLKLLSAMVNLGGVSISSKKTPCYP
jgi:hypothetical protein